MDRENQIEQAQERIKKLNEEALKFKKPDASLESEKESVWKRKPVNLYRNPGDNDPLNLIFKTLTEISKAIEDLSVSIRNKNSNDLVTIEILLKEVYDLNMDFNLSNNDLAYNVKIKLNQVRDLRLRLKESVNWRKINDLKQIELKMEESKQLILKIQSDEANGFKFSNNAD